MRGSNVTYVVLAIIGIVAWAYFFGEVDDCSQELDPELSITGCTEMIDSGRYSRMEVAIAFNNRALAYSELGEHDMAIEDLNPSIRLDPKDYISYYNRGLTYSDIGKHALAVEDFSKALQREPSDIDAYFYRADAYNELGELAKAIEDYGRVLQHSPDDADTYNSRAWAEYRLGRNMEAMTGVERSLSLQSGDP